MKAVYMLSASLATCFNFELGASSHKDADKLKIYKNELMVTRNYISKNKLLIA